MYSYLATAILAAVIAATGSWQIQNWRYGALENEYAQATIESQRLAGVAIRAADARVIAAQNSSAARANRATADARDARTELGRVLHAADDSVAAAKLSHQACIDNSIALKDVFGVCERERGELAEKADGHVNDIRTLTEAWPE